MTENPTSHHVQGLILATAGAIAFSVKAIIVKLAYRYGVDAVTLLMYRMLFALPLFLSVVWWSGRGKPPLTRRDWGMVFGLGFSGYYLASYLDFAGLEYIDASLERLILYLNPTLVLILSIVLYRARVSGRQWLALSVSYAGVLVVFGHTIHTLGPHAVLGAALVFGSALSYALYLIFSAQAVARLGTLRLAGTATSIAAVLCIVQFFILRSPSAMVVASQVLWLSLLNATVSTFIPVLLVTMALKCVGPAVASQASLIGPLSTIILAVLILGEPFTVWIAVGTGLVIAGIWLLTRWRVV